MRPVSLLSVLSTLTAACESKNRAASDTGVTLAAVAEPTAHTDAGMSPGWAVVGPNPHAYTRKRGR